MSFNLDIENKIDLIRKNIQNSKKPIMLFDVDTDGSMSYLQLKREFKKIKGFPFDKDFKKQKKLLDFIKSKLNFNSVDLIIIFDLPFLTEEFLSLIKDKKIIWVDHHPTNDKDLIKKYNIIHLNPLDYDKKDNRPSCYWSYLISNNLENLDLIALGSVADFFLLDVLIDLYKYNQNKFRLLFKLSDEKRKEIFEFLRLNSFNEEKIRNEREEIIRYLSYETKLGFYKNFFDFICKFEDIEDSLRAFRIVEKLSFEDLIAEINAGKFFPFNDFLTNLNEYKKILKNASSLEQKEFFCYDYIGKFSFAKALSEELNYRFIKSKVVCICFKKVGKEWYSCSLRGKGVVVNEIVAKALEGLNGRGGGHPFAAGVSINSKDYFKFKKRLMDYFDLN